MVEWNTGMEYWNGILEWNTGMEYWNGILEYWNGILEWWNGILEWNTRMEYSNGIATCAELYVARFFHVFDDCQFSSCLGLINEARGSADSPIVIDSDESCSQSSPVKIVPRQKFR